MTLFLHLPPFLGGRDGRVPTVSASFFDCMCYCVFCSPGGPVGVEALQSHYKGVTSRYTVVTRCYGAVTIRYEPLRSWMAPKSLCLTTAFAPAPAFLGGSCPLGCSLSAPATGGFSVVSPQYIRYAAGSEKEKRAGGRLHGGTIAHPFVFCKGGGAEAGRGFLVWPAPSFSGGSGLACAVVPPGPPSNVFRNRGTPPVPPAGVTPPAPLLGRGSRRR